MKVVMEIEKKMRRIGCRKLVMGKKNRVEGCVEKDGIKKDRVKVLKKKIGRIEEIGIVGRVGRNRIDKKKIEKEVEDFVEIGVEMVEKFVEW